MDKIFGTLSEFLTTNLDGDISGMHLGAGIACVEFQKNVIQHGGFDCCHYLLGRGRQSDEDIAKYIGSQGWDPRKILIYDGALPLSRLQKNNYHVIHIPNMSIGDLFALRHVLGHPLAPGTAVTHTVSYAWFMTVWTELLLNNVLPCDAIVCTSRAGREVLGRSFELLSERLSSRLGVKVPGFKGSMEIIPLGVDVEYWKPGNNKEEAKKRLGLSEQACLILCQARFSPHDKMDLRPLLMTVRRLQDVLGSDFFQVAFVGDDMRTGGRESKLLRKFVDELGLPQVVRIDTSGFASTIREYYRAADVFVSLVDNIQETFGLTVIQAMACGLPVVVSDWDGYKDTVVHGETGFRVQTYWADCDGQISGLACRRPWTVDHLLLAQSVAVDMDEAFHYLYDLTRNPDMRRRMGEAGRKRAEEIYAWPVVIKRYTELWDACRETFEHIDLQQWERKNRASLFAPAYFQQFSHYPSAIISPETQLAPLSKGAEMASAERPTREVQLPPEMETVFRPAIFQDLTSRLSDWPVTFGSLVEEVSRKHEQRSDVIARHIMWLIKYGVVKPIKPTPNAHSVIGEEAATPHLA